MRVSSLQNLKSISTRFLNSVDKEFHQLIMKKCLLAQTLHKIELDIDTPIMQCLIKRQGLSIFTREKRRREKQQPETPHASIINVRHPSYDEKSVRKKDMNLRGE